MAPLRGVESGRGLPLVRLEAENPPKARLKQPAPRLRVPVILGPHPNGRAGQFVGKRQSFFIPKKQGLELRLYEQNDSRLGFASGPSPSRRRRWPGQSQSIFNIKRPKDLGFAKNYGSAHAKLGRPIVQSLSMASKSKDQAYALFSN